MKNLIAGFAFSILPIYSFVTWLIVFYDENFKTQQERVREFRKLFFEVQLDLRIFGLIQLLFALLAIFFFIRSFGQLKNPVFKGISAIFILFLGFLVFYNVWGLL